MAEIVLASASPRRRELLGVITDTFIVAPADVDEQLDAQLSLPENVRALSEKKALASKAAFPNAYCIGSDTLVIINGQALGKPRDAAQAVDMLQQLSGNRHTVLTGIAVAAPDGNMQSHVTQTQVYFRALTQEEIMRYVATKEPMDKAGAYGIQGHGALLVDHIDGDYYSVMGLPVARLYEMLRDMGALQLGCEEGSECRCVENESLHSL